MGSPEALFCEMIETQYKSVVVLIELAIKLPQAGLVSLKSVYQRLYYVTYKIIESAIDVLEAQILAIFDMLSTDINDVRDAWCKIAFSCKPLTDMLFSDSGPLSTFLSSAQLISAKDNYDDFNDFVCQNGMSELITGYGDVALDAIKEQLDALKERLNPVENFLDELISDYLRIVSDSGIYEWLDKLDEWADCGFALCTSLETALNKQDDTLDRMSMTKQGNSYVFVAQEWLNQVYDKKNFLNRKITNLENIIGDWSDVNTRKSWVSSNGKPKDELSKS